MRDTSLSALITDKGARVLLRVSGKVHEFTQRSLRRLLGVPAGPPGLGITVERDRIQFDFVRDGRAIELSSSQLQRRIAQCAGHRPNGRGQRKHSAAHATI